MTAEYVTIILAEASLELVPQQIAGHSAVVKNARRRGRRPTETLLDVSLHYHAMRRLSKREKRGRPDIVHITLLELLSSPLNLEGRLRVYVHTLNDYVLFIDPTTRIPKNYNRFVGLMEQLFVEGQIPPQADKPLITMKPATLSSLLKMLGFDNIILLSEWGKLRSPTEICSESLKQDIPMVIGAFPHGDFEEETKALARSVYAIYPKPLETWVVASRITHACEELLGILPKGKP